jgi:hydrogenase maturation protease
MTRGFASAAGQSPRVLVLGLGNPILGDDGVGWKVAEALKAMPELSQEVEVDRLAVGGLSLMERMLGYDHVVLVDSMQTDSAPVGTVDWLPLSELEHSQTGHTSSAHDTTLPTALRAAKAMGAHTPARVDILAIEATACMDFAEVLSTPVSEAVPVAARKIVELLRFDAGA